MNSPAAEHYMPKIERCSEGLSARASAELMYILERKIRLEDHTVRMNEVLALRSELGKRDWFKLLGRVWVACAGYNSHPYKDQLRQELREAGEACFEMFGVANSY
jgi:hypothetical protein